MQDTVGQDVMADESNRIALRVLVPFASPAPSDRVEDAANALMLEGRRERRAIHVAVELP